MFESMNMSMKFLKQKEFWNAPLTAAVISAILTGIVFAGVLFYFADRQEFNNAHNAIKSELRYNYEILKSTQDISSADNVPNGPTEKEMLEAFRNMPEHGLSFVNWTSQQSVIARKQKNIYNIRSCTGCFLG